MKFATTKQRIIHYLDFKGISVKIFLEKTEIKRGFLDSDKLEATVSDVFIAKIIASYPEINVEWLLTGKGVMLKNNAGDPSTIPVSVHDTNYKELAEARLEVIEGLKFKIATLEQRLAQDKSITRGVLVPAMAEPASQLIKNPVK